MSREEFLRILWSRFCDESMSHHPVTLGYGRMLIEMQEWDKAETNNKNIVVKIGGYV